MKSFAVFFVMALAIVAVHCKESTATAQDTTTTTSTVTSSTASTKTNSTTTTTPTKAPTTTPISTLSTTQTQTNSSTASTTSQEAGNTTVTSTTQQTTTPNAPTEAPIILPPPSPGKWHVNDSTHVCIMLDMGVRFIITYKDDNDKSREYAWNFPNDTVATGSCGSNTTGQQIIIDGGKAGELSMTFSQQDKKVLLQKVKLAITLTKDFPGINTARKVVTMANDLDLMNAAVGNSYLCKSNQSVALNGSEDTTVKMSTVDLQVQAFIPTPKKGEKGGFGDAQECPMDAETSNIVPIAVGAALAALVVIVLIAYLISRNRNKRGYESV